MADVTMDDLAAQREVEATVKRSGTSFYQGMRILPKDRRMAMWAIYAFCRVVDDIADEPAIARQKQEQLNLWRQRIDALYEGRPSEAITQTLLPAVKSYRLRREDFLAIIDGMETDAFQDVVAPSWDELDLYCDRVASAVGRLSVRAFGDGSARADDVAWALGRALQFTNILRDIAEDAERGRVYLPKLWLNEAGIIKLDSTDIIQHPRLAKVCERMAKQAHRYFTAAESAMKDCDASAMRPARMMAAMYRAILYRLERRGWSHLNKPVSVPKYQKLWLILRHGIL